MVFRESEVDNFKQLFEESKDQIRTFPGVMHLELLQEDSALKNVFFTYSYWQSEEDLENYRHSALFQAVWGKTKPLFKEKAQAWSTKRLHQLS